MGAGHGGRMRGFLRLPRRAFPHFRVRDWLLVVMGVLVGVAMVATAELAREDAQRHFRAQTLVQTLQLSSQELSAITARALAYSLAGNRLRLNETSITRAFAVWARLQKALGDLRSTASGNETRILQGDAARVYVGGERTLAVLTSGGLLAATRAEQTLFEPALQRINADAEAASRLERRAGDQASTRELIAFVGSLTLGLLALGLLGWRLEAGRRKLLLAGQRHAMEASSEARIRALLEHSRDVVTVIGPDLLVEWQAPSMVPVLGHEPSSLVGQPLTSIVDPDQRASVERFLASTLERAGSSAITARFRHADGSWLYLEAIAVNRLHDHAVGGIVLSMRDVTERQAREDDLRHRAFHDPLTGLANRALFEEHLSRAIAAASRQEHTFAVLFLDLDDFKTINDTLGHDHGDELLCDAAARISGILRPSDTAARLGGDEFAVLIDALKHDEEASVVAGRILDALAFPFIIGGHDVLMTASIGVTVCNGSTVVEDLLRDADTAMYVVKQHGKASMRIFHPGMRSHGRHARLRESR